MKKLNKEGFHAYDASVAPHGSAWDRACELYAQLTGSVTDYGAEHSARCGHPRYGRDFSKDPLIPQWDENHKVTTLAAPHNGTSAYHIPDEETKSKSWIQKIVEKSYAPKKDGRADYDYADFDMHIQNADKINSWLKTLPEAYYFSYACSATTLSKNGRKMMVL